MQSETISMEELELRDHALRLANAIEDLKRMTAMTEMYLEKSKEHDPRIQSGASFMRGSRFKAGKQ